MSDSEVFRPSPKGMQVYAVVFKKWSGESKIHSKICTQFFQGFAYGPEMETCVKNQTLKDKECLVSCGGLYADISDDSLRQNMVEGWWSLSVISFYWSTAFQTILQKIGQDGNLLQEHGETLGSSGSHGSYLSI